MLYDIWFLYFVEPMIFFCAYVHVYTVLLCLTYLIVHCACNIYMLFGQRNVFLFSNIDLVILIPCHFTVNKVLFMKCACSVKFQLEQHITKR